MSISLSGHNHFTVWRPLLSTNISLSFCPHAEQGAVSQETQETQRASPAVDTKSRLPTRLLEETKTRAPPEVSVLPSHIPQELSGPSRAGVDLCHSNSLPPYFKRMFMMYVYTIRKRPVRTYMLYSC